MLPFKGKQRLLVVVLVMILFFNVRQLNNFPSSNYLSLWQQHIDILYSSVQTTHRMKVIILTMNRFDSLQRLFRSLEAADYQGDSVDIMIRFDLPKHDALDEWRKQVDAVCSSLEWTIGNVDVTIAEQNMGLRQAWLTAWRPQSIHERAIILEDDVEVSPLWYQWIKGSYEAYGDRDDIAGFSLQRQTLVPHKSFLGNTKIPDNGGLPFLYKLVGSIGYAPLASKWMDFLDFAECALATQKDVDTPSLITADWYRNLDQTGMWTQLFIYFCDYYNLYTLYAFPTDNLALAAHWREKGEHFDKTGGRDFALVDSAKRWAMEYPASVPKLDWNAKPTPNATLKTLFLSAAVGYEIEDFERFLPSLRNHYSGDVSILVWEKAATEIFDILAQYQVHTVTTAESGGPRVSAAWRKVNQVRWEFFQNNCQEGKYDLCMAADFRDVLFQDDPFRNMTAGRRGEEVLHLYAHNILMNEWHLTKAYECTNRNQQLRGKDIINAGAFIASPTALPRLAKWIVYDARLCDDQVALNLAVYGDVFSDVSITLHPQGQGSINNVAWGGKFRRDSRDRFLNRNCFPAPVVHQFDILDE